MSKGYLHGFSKKEQDRLYRQAAVLAAIIYKSIDFTNTRHLVEVGSGVGAQTEQLLAYFPHLKITGIDAEALQVARAREHLAAAIQSGRVTFDIGNALQLPYPDCHFDGAFVCWFLEHVQDPVAILRELRRVLVPGAPIYCNEVLNASFYVHPYSPATLQYWFHFNDQQWNLGGDPFVGGKLANLLMAAGYRDIETTLKYFHGDNRSPEARAGYIEYWTTLLLSGAPELIRVGKVSPELVQAMTAELASLKESADAVIFFAWVQAHARV